MDGQPLRFLNYKIRTSLHFRYRSSFCLRSEISGYPPLLNRLSDRFPSSELTDEHLVYIPHLGIDIAEPLIELKSAVSV